MSQDQEKAKQCPLISVHRRMDEAHNLWHEALASYAYTEKFRLSLNSCIQTLRNVTFHLQKQKDVISNFDDWYAPWQQKMAQNEVMKWLIRARNIVVKEGDLETKSMCRVSVVSSYLEPPYVEYEVNPLKKHTQIANERQIIELPKHILENGTLRVERRWVVNDLPQWELLDALAKSYGVLSELVNDCHKHMGISKTRVAEVKPDGNCQLYNLPTEHLRGQLPCMATTMQTRTL